MIDPAAALQHFQRALKLYATINEPYSISMHRHNRKSPFRPIDRTEASGLI
jgi:hypothetical protein